MPRRNQRKHRRRADAARPLPRDGAAFYGTQVQPGPSWSFGAAYLVRRMGATAATKFYVCPGCNQDIPPGVSHVVAWPQDRTDERRHWHTPCWERR